MFALWVLFSRRSPLSGTLASVTMIKVPLVQEHRPAESAAEERLWDALATARSHAQWSTADKLQQDLARLHLPLARSIAQATVAEFAADRVQAERAAEAALAHAVAGWQYRTGGGFRSYARTAILHGLQGQPVPSLSA